MEELREKRDELALSKRKLELQLATESDPARIESIARNELGMEYPRPEQIVVIEAVGPDSEVKSTAARSPDTP
jgi:cell division protein FtsL